MSRNTRRPGWLAAIGLALLAVPAIAQRPQQIDGASDNYDELFERYVAAARATGTPAQAVRPNWMAGLAGDFRARYVNDLVTIQVIESIVGAGSADSNLTKKSSGAGALSNFFGLETKLPNWLDPTNLVNHQSDTTFKGGGTTNRQGALTAVVTARVAEVLPSGDLVIEGVREIDINGDRQIVVLTGIARPSDIGPSNVVLSTSLGQLRIRYFGRGLIRDNLKPGWLVRILNKIF